MKTRLAILGAAMTGTFLLSSCGEEAPQMIGSDVDGSNEMEDDEGPMPGVLLPPPSPSPGAAQMPAAVSPGVAPGVQPGIQPGIQPGVMPTSGTVPPAAATDMTGRPIPPMPPTGVVPPPATVAPPPATVTPVTPDPAVTPTEPEPEPAAECEAAWTVGSSGFVSAPGASSCWQGYAWLSATPEGESTIATSGGGVDFSDCGGDCMLCVAGTVAPTADFSGVGILGVNLNQLQSSSTPDTLSVTGSVDINVSNAGGSPLRVQLSGSKDWCVDISGMDGAVSLTASDFTTECWEGGDQVPYDGEEVEALMLIVPGSDTDATDFDICLNSVTPG
jgi:hypothetical protein